MVPNYFKKWFGKKTSTLKYTQPCRVLTTNPAVVGPVWNKRSLLAAAPECAFTWNSFCFCGTLLSTCLRAELEKVRRATCWSAWEQQEPAKSPHEKGYGPISRKKKIKKTIKKRHNDNIWSKYFVKENGMEAGSIDNSTGISRG